jgi:hypothetical protein
MNFFEHCFTGLDTDKINGHSYGPAYEDAFYQIRDEIKLVFEIGVFAGGSIKGFRKYFHNALIVGIDVDPNVPRLNGDRTAVEIGDASNKAFIEKLLEKYGLPDIVIDDGSHASSHIKKSFSLLFASTKICYVIEDLFTQYPEFERGTFIDDGVQATFIIHEKMDEILRMKSNCNIKIWPNIAFIFKGQR